MEFMGDTTGASAAGMTAVIPTRRVAFGAFIDWEAEIRMRLEPRYVPTFVEFDRAPLDGFDVVAPLHIHHYPPLWRRPDLRGRKFLHPDEAAVAICDDKARLGEFLIAAGLGDHVPAFRAPGPPYPYVWKQRSGYYGMHCRVITGPQDEAGLDLGDRGWFAQALVPGQVEFAAHILLARGEVRYASTFAYEMPGEGLVKGAAHWPHTTRMMRGCPYLGLFAEILSRLDYEGVACIDFKLADGRPQLLEINPRFGGSLKFDVNAYLDAYVQALEAG